MPRSAAIEAVTRPRIVGGTTRVTIPSGALGSLQVLYVRSIPKQPGSIALPEVDVSDYAGRHWDVLRQDILFVKNDSSPAGPYTVENRPAFTTPDQDNAWAVVATPSGAIAACPMEGASMWLGTREHAQRWADTLNEKFGFTVDDAPPNG